ncbi:tyrosine-type recombinase/integrase [Denitromonas iodatirespirans]|uniref:Tyrosine-type recombinase/integrase n=2 Tax=Rhodocyclales TaxID=206389 RepID=A0A944HD22_DENI1|nr:tyrosine-type recombinase/integrase [Denitromonas iodatirespirans]MBT0961676.1 tyrosine-type recombinase/integrase [Denitromonas iodatirespirans]
MSRLLAATLGRLAPRYRTLNQWAEVYKQILAARPISDKTRANRRCAQARVFSEFGDRTISSIRPHEVGAMILRLHARYPQAAKRTLFEARDIFDEAIHYGWLDRNPAGPIKAPRVRVRRRRLSLDQWQQIHGYAAANLPPWVSRMMVLALVTGQRRSDLVAMRFDHIWDGRLHVEQVKTGTRIALPLQLRLDAIGVSLEDAVDDCRAYAAGDGHLLRKHNGRPPGLASLSSRFEESREAVMQHHDDGLPPSLHECRSLAERLYRAQGIDTRILLGHKHQSMTDLYHDDRGLTAASWQLVHLPN